MKKFLTLTTILCSSWLLSSCAHECDGNFTGENCDQCSGNWSGSNCDIEPSCVNGTANIGITGDGHCSDCNSDWSGINCDIANECQNGDADTGIDGGGHCKSGSCLGNYAGENCNRCKEHTSDVMYDQVCNEYRTTVIDGSTWMAENMNYKIGTYYHANGDETNDATYGLLYDLETATTICPTGWHLPTKQEFDDLLTYVSNNRTSSSNFLALIAKLTAWTSYSNQGGNDFSFGGLPAGYCYSGNYNNFGCRGIFWSSTEYDSSYAYCLYLGDGSADVSYNYKALGFSVRCLKD